MAEPKKPLSDLRKAAERLTNATRSGTDSVKKTAAKASGRADAQAGNEELAKDRAKSVSSLRTETIISRPELRRSEDNRAEDNRGEPVRAEGAMPESSSSEMNSQMSRLRTTRSQTSDAASTGSDKGSESSMTDRDAARKARLRRQEVRRQARAKRVRRIIALIGAAAAIIVILLVVRAVRRHGSAARRGSDTAAGTEVSVDGGTVISGDEVLHLSLPRLHLSNGSSEGRPNEMTVNECSQLLNDLYERGYVLVGLRGLTQRDENGTYAVSTIAVPEGKTPLILSLRNAAYSQEDAERGYATGLELNEDGKLTNTYADANGGTRTGSCDVITCVDDFIEAHPDFSADGSRGIIGLTSDQGVLGYADGTSEACQEVINTLFEEGWVFAGNGAHGTSLGSEWSLFQEDVSQWQETIPEAVGKTEILLLPDGADIGNSSPYSSDNRKYQMLSEEGFIYYCIDDTANLIWIQAGDGFVRQAMHEVNSYEQYDALMNNGLDSFVRIRASEEQAAKNAVYPEGDSAVEDGEDDSETQNGQHTPEQTEPGDQDDGEVIIEEEAPI